MTGRKNIFVILGFVLSVSLIASSVCAFLVSYHSCRSRFELLGAVCGEAARKDPETKKMIAAALKEYKDGKLYGMAEDNLLTALGYRISDFSGPLYGQIVFSAAAGFLMGVFVFAFTFLYRNKRETMRIRALADYLEQVNTGKAVLVPACGEDDFSALEDEIYKTVTSLCYTKEKAVQAKNDFAENLFNIAHQIKTPITALSLSVQMLKEDFGSRHPEHHKERSLQQIEKQLLRLTHLEEALLVLSRIDAGTLLLQKDEVDVFTLLVLAADNLQELFAEADTSIDVPELGEVLITADLNWTMEAVMNLMKNCMEHSHGGTIHCSYGQNPLYTEIFIWDEGEGFAKEDIPHLFERFYRGRNAGGGGIGIGLALSKEMIERQNGTIRAANKPGGGALFEIHFYRQAVPETRRCLS